VRIKNGDDGAPQCKNLLMFMRSNSRDDRAHLRTYVPVLGENRPTYLDMSCFHSEMTSIGRLMEVLTAAMIIGYTIKNLVGF